MDGLYDRAHADNQEVLRPYDEATIGYKSLGGIYSIAYIVPAIAIIIGKGLHLSFCPCFFTRENKYLTGIYNDHLLCDQALALWEDPDVCDRSFTDFHGTCIIL